MNDAADVHALGQADFSDTLPSLDMVEGNGEADWAAWEDSVAFQNSQIAQDAHQTHATRQAATARQRLDEGLMDPFGSINRKSA